jgi:hypothetical protein
MGTVAQGSTRIALQRAGLGGLVAAYRRRLAPRKGERARLTRSATVAKLAVPTSVEPSSSRIVVTGGTGFLGRHRTRALAARGYAGAVAVGTGPDHARARGPAARRRAAS